MVEAPAGRDPWTSKAPWPTFTMTVVNRSSRRPSAVESSEMSTRRSMRRFGSRSRGDSHAASNDGASARTATTATPRNRPLATSYTVVRRSGGGPAVEGQDLAGDPLRLVGGQEDHGGAHVGG